MTMKRNAKAKHTEALATESRTGILTHVAAMWQSPKAIKRTGRTQMTKAEYTEIAMGRGTRTGERIDNVITKRVETSRLHQGRVNRQTTRRG